MNGCFDLLLPRYDIGGASFPTSSLFSPPSSTPGNKESSDREMYTNRGGEHSVRQRNASSVSFYSLSSDEEEEEFEEKEISCSDDKDRGEDADAELTLEDGSSYELKESKTAEEDARKVEERMLDKCPETGTVGDHGNKRDIVANRDLLCEEPPENGNKEEGVGDMETTPGNRKEVGVDRTPTSGGSEKQSNGGSMASSGEEDSDSEVEWEDVEPCLSHPLLLQEHGITSRGYSVAIELPLSDQVEVREDKDNTSIVATLLECHRLLKGNYLPTILRWLEVCMNKNIST